MSKGILAFGLCILLLCSMIIPVSLGYIIKNKVEQQPSIFGNGNTLYVGGDGPGNYTTIQEAIDDAVDGDTVYVFNDSSPYNENIRIKNSINLIGEDKNTTIIEGSVSPGITGVIVVDAEGINITGFTVRFDIPNPPKGKNGIYIDYCWGNGNESIIYGNIITNTYCGILIESSNENRVFDNLITRNQVGIGFSGYYGYSSENYVYNNDINQCGGGIIFAVVYGGCYCNYIYDNLIWKNEVGIGFNSGLGLYDGVNDNYIYFNNILYNDGGLYLNAANRQPPKNNLIDVNNFIGNINYNVRFYDKPGLNYWDDKGFGNYWDDYTGKDNDEDGIGDTPYIIDKSQGVINKDNYPLMKPFGDFDPDAPDAPEINGSTNPKPRVKYEYTFVTTDPNNDDVYYYISWGDGTYKKWIGPYNSGEEVSFNHTWIEKRNYVITAQAKDTNGLVGCWGTLPIIMSRNRATHNSLFLRLFELFPILREVILRLIR